MPEFARGSVLWEGVFGAAILGGALIIAFLAHPFLTRLAKVFTGKTKSALDDLLLAAVSRPIFIFVLAQGFFSALTVISFLDRWQGYVNRAWIVSVSVVLLFGLQRLLNAVLRWYGQELATRKAAQANEQLLPLARRVVTAAIYVGGGLLILDNLGIRISPLLAGLGIGGLAVALALQPTLSNFFAGTYLVSANVLKMGDFIEMEGGIQGYVMEVGWRSTRIRTSYNNLVVIPNSRLADSVLTNYFEPSMEMGVMVEAGVSYSSDLAHVRQVALEVASELVSEMPEAARDVQPWFGYERFGDSNVDFWVWVHAKDRIGSFALKSELMVRLHARFAAEGIEINYPVRKLVFGDHAQAFTEGPIGGATLPRASTKPSPPTG